MHDVRGVFDHAVAFLHGFVHETEFAVLEITDTAMRHVGGCGRGAGAEIGALDQQHVHAIERQVAEGAYAVDAPADDKDGGGFGFKCF